jgi:hypothetical protein
MPRLLGERALSQAKLWVINTAAMMMDQAEIGLHLQ